MADLNRVDELLRAINPVPDERDALRVVRPTDPLWQTIRSRLATAAAPGDADDLARIAVSDRPRADRDRLQRLAVAAGIVLLVVTAVVGVRLVGADTVEPVGDPETGQEGTEGAGDAVVPVRPGDDVELLVTFSGGDGAEACRYEGPTVFIEGRYASRLVNTAGETVAVNLDTLTPGHSYQDFLERMGSESGEPPFVVPPEDQDPSVHAWLDGSFRTVRNLGSDAGDIVLLPGSHVLYCWNDGGDGDLHLWPAGMIEVMPQP